MYDWYEIAKKYTIYKDENIPPRLKYDLYIKIENTPIKKENNSEPINPKSVIIPL